MSLVVKSNSHEQRDQSLSESSFSIVKELFSIDENKSIKVGLMDMTTRLDLHLFVSEKDKLIPLAKIELTGKRKNTDPKQASFGSYLININKKDRGKVSFRVVEPEPQLFKLRFSSFNRPGEITVNINTRNLDGHERPLIGASNQTFQNLSIPRKPIHQDDIAILDLALKTKNYRRQGLLDPDSIRDFCNDFRSLSENWEKLQPKERIFEIRTISNRVLMQSGVYPCYFPEGYVASWNKFSPRSLTRFYSENWSLYRSPSFVDKDSISYTALSDFAACLYKELRHIEQTWLVIRFLSGNYPRLFSHADFSGNINEVIALAKKFPLDKDSGQQEFCRRLFEDMTTDLAVKLQTNYLGNNFLHPSKLTILQRLKFLSGGIVLFHEQDALAAKKAVKKYLRRAV